MRSDVNMSVSEAGSPNARSLAIKLFVKGELITTKSLSPVESLEAVEVSRQYAALFDKGCSTGAAKDYMDLLGATLFRLWFEDSWSLVPHEGARLVVSSDIPEILSTPWEIVSLPEGISLGTDPRFHIRRQPSVSDFLPRFEGDLPPGPLRVLFAACDPLSFDDELRSMMESLGGSQVIFEVCDTGTLEELRTSVEQFKPHLVHISGQAAVKGGIPQFTFEGESGGQDIHPPSDLSKALKGVQCALLSGCQAKTPWALGAVARSLVPEIPLVLSWNASSADFSRLLYPALAAGQALDDALSLARIGISKICGETDRTCPMPFLYAASDQPHIFDPTKQAEVPYNASREQMSLPGMAAGYAESFVDRRREIQRFMTALREGAIMSLIITGRDGSGKTALAARISERLSALGYSTVALYSCRHNPITAARVLDTLSRALARHSGARNLKDPRVSVTERLSTAASLLGQGKYLLVLDGLSLDAAGKLQDRELAAFCLRVMDNPGSARLIATSTSLPADAAVFSSRAREGTLGWLPESASIKFLLEDEKVVQRYRSGDLPFSLLREIYRAEGGMPACLSQIRCILRTLTPEKLRPENICEDALVDLHMSLSPESRTMLSKAAVYDIAVSLSGIRATAGEGALDHLGEWKEVSLAWSLPGDLWAFPFQGWLSSLLGDDDARDAHRAAGAFLEDLAKRDLSSEIGLSRLDCSMEARGQYLEGRDLEKARAVTAYISGYLERLGLFSEVARLNEELLAREDHPATMTWLGRAYAGLGNYPSARQWYQKAMEAGPEASSCMSLASLQVKEGDYAGARANFSRAEELCRASEDLRGQASALHALASVDMAQGNNDAARQELLQVIDLQRRAGDLRGETATLQNLATLDLRQGNYGSAMESFEASLKLSQASGDKAKEAAVLYNMASVDFEKGEHDKARGEYLKSLEIKRALGDRSDEAVILYRMAALDSQAGNLDSAVEEFIKALGIYQQLGDRSGEAGAFFQLGALAVQKNRILEGLRLIVLSSVILRSEGSPDVNQVDPLIDGLATRLNLSQAQFVQMIREVTAFYRRDGGKGLLATALGPS